MEMIRLAKIDGLVQLSGSEGRNFPYCSIAEVATSRKTRWRCHSWPTDQFFRRHKFSQNENASARERAQMDGPFEAPTSCTGSSSTKYVGSVWRDL